VKPRAVGADHDERHTGGRGRPGHTHEVGAGKVGTRSRKLLPPQVLRDTAQLPLEDVGLGAEGGGSRSRNRAPMVEHLRHVYDPVSALGAAKRQVPVLRTVKCRVEPSDLPEHRAPDRAVHEVVR
jgi:hypothetical protein